MTDLEFHPRNAGYVWQPHGGPFRLLTHEQARQFDEQGYVLVRGCIAPDVVAAVEAIADELERRGTRRLEQRPDRRDGISAADEITFTVHVTAADPELRRFASSPPFTDLAHDLVGPDVRLYWDQLVYKKPEMPRDFPWHQDNGYRFVEPQAYLTCWTPLTPATVDNGCPWVYPGLHRLGTLAHRPGRDGLVCREGEDGAVAVEADPGDVVVFSSLTPHRTGPNLTGAVRKAYILQYAPEGARWPAEGGVPCNDPDWQFEVLRGGQPVV